jgi:hypothetical protein
MVSRFRIVLNPPYSMTDQKAHHFLPGDRVSGKVILTAKDGEKIKNISITLKGSFFAKATRYNLIGTYSFDIFKLSKTLLQGPAKMAASTYEYSFFVEIPKQFTNPTTWEGSPKPSDLYSDPPDPLWPIPPTCEDAHQLRDQYSDWKIVYSLAAQAEKTLLSLGDELPIVINHCRPSLNPGPGPVRQEARDVFKQRYTLTSEGIPRALSKAETLKENIQHNGNNYSLYLSLLAQPTTAIIIGEPFTIAFMLQIDSSKSDYKMPMPEFQLRDYTIHFCSSTSVSVEQKKEKRYNLGTTALTPFELFPSKRTVNAPLRINEPVKMQETLPSSFRSPPSFKTVLIERRYYFQIQAHVSCLDNTVKMKILLPFWLHSPKVQGQAAALQPLVVTNTTQPVYQPPQQQVAPQPFPAPVVTNNPRVPGATSSASPENRTTGRFCGSCGAGRPATTTSFCTQCGAHF